MRSLIACLMMAFWGCDHEVDNGSKKSLFGREIGANDLGIIPVLDASIPSGESVVWCASFQIAWNRLAKDVAKCPLQIRGAEELCQRLNTAMICEEDLPAGTFYAAAGWMKNGIKERIRSEIAVAFPSIAVPDIGEAETAAIAYAYMEENIKFGIPFYENRKPLVFKDSTGRETKVASFGIRREDASTCNELRSQVEILYAGPMPPLINEFAIDLFKNSTPVQIILARIPVKTTLAATVETVEQKIRTFTGDQNNGIFGANDVLLVPNIAFRLTQRFKELEGKDRTFTNSGIEGKWIFLAQQAISFRIDRSGVDLNSKAVISITSAPKLFIFNGPFLVYLKKRGGVRPFFALWIDKADILDQWHE
jgi:hypothetical protein